MTPGLPGAGIGGLFYLLAALFSPVWETVRLLRRSSARRRWGAVLRLFALAVSILAAMWLTAWMVAAVFSLSPRVDGNGTASSIAAMPETIGKRMALLTVSTLALVLVGVELLRLLFPKIRHTQRRCSDASLAPANSTDSLPLRALGGE